MEYRCVGEPWCTGDNHFSKDLKDVQGCQNVGEANANMVPWQNLSEETTETIIHILKLLLFYKKQHYKIIGNINTKTALKRSCVIIETEEGWQVMSRSRFNYIDQMTNKNGKNTDKWALQYLRCNLKKYYQKISNRLQKNCLFLHYKVAEWLITRFHHVNGLLHLFTRI